MPSPALSSTLSSQRGPVRSRCNFGNYRSFVRIPGPGPQPPGHPILGSQAPAPLLKSELYPNPARGAACLLMSSPVLGVHVSHPMDWWVGPRGVWTQRASGGSRLGTMNEAWASPQLASPQPSRGTMRTRCWCWWNGGGEPWLPRGVLRSLGSLTGLGGVGQVVGPPSD